ncbi:uncharacterized protein LOC117652938 [Thrips palmi]|uniref:Uncharacterized protein LOC117652938 n=1 Tax=Thrips palmi TaxID=161013 RepID=A0A6P9AE85_THRPL|nr:uncharacterized protein LOC117652938 [Thrips palmi]
MTSQLTLLLTGALLLVSQGRADTLLSPTEGNSGSMNRLIASYSDMDPFRWESFYSLPLTAAAAKKAGWAEVAGTDGQGRTAGLVSTWCRRKDYRVCLLFDLAGVVAGIQVSVSVSDFEKSFGSKQYPIHEESQWRRGTLLGTEVFSATALFVDPSVLMAGGRVDWQDGDEVLQDALLLENGASYWAMPSTAEDAGGVAFTKQGCVRGAGRHYAYNMSPSMACEEHRPFFLLFDDVTGRLQGFGVSLYGKASHNWFGRWWLEAPRRGLVQAMFPSAPQCFLDWTRAKGLVTLHVYLRDAPWKAACAA